jgi:hypothetical protein
MYEYVLAQQDVRILKYVNYVKVVNNLRHA